MFDKSSFAKTILFSLVLHCSLSNVWSNDDVAESNQKFLGDPSVDVEKARSHMREQRAKRLRWELMTTLGDYERVGKKDVRWDDAAREALIQNAHLLAGEREADDRRDEIKAAFQKALSAGCTDPLVGYFSLRFGCYPPSTPPAEVADLFANVERSLQASQYAAIRKCYASLRAGEQAFKAHKVSKQSASPASIDTISAFLSRAETQFVTLLRDASANRDSVYDLAENAFFDFTRDVVTGRSQVFDPLAKFFDNNKSKITGDDPGAGLIEGEFWSQYALSR